MLYRGILVAATLVSPRANKIALELGNNSALLNIDTTQIPQAEASPGELVGLQLVAAPQIDTESSPQVLPQSCDVVSLE